MNQAFNWMSKNRNVLFFATIIFLSVFIYVYSDSKTSYDEGLGARMPELSPRHMKELDDTLGKNEDVKFATPTSESLPQSNVPAINPSELLPKDNNSEWNKLNVKNVNAMANVNPGPFQSMESSQPKRNRASGAQALRPEYAIPQKQVGPWNNSTIVHKQYGRGIGCE